MIDKYFFVNICFVLTEISAYLDSLFKAKNDALSHLFWIHTNKFSGLPRSYLFNYVSGILWFNSGHFIGVFYLELLLEYFLIEHCYSPRMISRVTV